MKRTSARLASGLLAAVLVMTPAVPVLAAGTGSGQQASTTSGQQVLASKSASYKAGAIFKAPGTHSAATAQMLRGTVSPMVLSGKATRVGDTDLNRQLQLDFVLKPRDKAKMTSLAAAGKKVSLAEYKAEFTPASSSLLTVQNFLKQSNLQIVNSTDDMFVVQGTAAQIEKALHIKFNDYKANNFKFYSTTTDPILPIDVANALQGIIGLTQTPYHTMPMQGKKSQLDASNNGFFTPDAVRTAYGMNTVYGNGIDGTGENIAILMTGDFSDSDVKTFSQTFGLPYDAKKITRKVVTKTKPTGIDEESTLDVEWSHAFAPGANITEYETGTLDDSNLFDGLDVIMATNPAVDVVNMSFGGSEGWMPANLLDSWHTKLAEATAKGITLVASSGDDGAYGYGDPTVGVQSPASDPFVLSVGGTSLTVDANNNRTDESAWGEAPFGQWDEGNTWGSGGGYSQVFSDLANGSSQKRGVPDVAALGQNVEMYEGQDGGWETADGTSFAAPMWTGIVALASQQAKHTLGWINPGINHIATDPQYAGDLHDITTGNNGAYQAKTGWDEVTGWGAPGNGWPLVKAMAAQSPGVISIGGPQIDGTVIGDMPYDSDQNIMNGTGTVDILGSGFGSQQGNGYVTLSQNGTSYQVPVTNWTDTDITLDVDNDGTGLLSPSVPHPSVAGTYQLAVHTDANATSGTTDVNLTDFLTVSDNSTSDQPTPVSGATPVYQNVTIQAYTPDGEAIDSGLADTTLSLDISEVWGNVDLSGFDVEQNGQPCLQNPDGTYQVTLSGGQATLQVASKYPGAYLYVVTGPGLYGYDDAPCFATQSQTSTQLVNEMLPGYNVAATGRDNLVTLALEDAYGNMTGDGDHIEVELAQNPDGSYPTGNITINDPNNSDPNHGDLPVTPPTGPDPTYLTTMVEGSYSQTYLNVSDTVAEPVTLTITDLDNAAVQPLEVPLIFTAAHTLQLTGTDVPNGVPVTVDGQTPNWQQLQISALDADGNETTFAGEVDLQVMGNQDLSDQPTAYQVEVYEGDSNSWQPITADQDGIYSIDLSKGTQQVRVASPKAEDVTYQASMYFSFDYAQAQYFGKFAPTTLAALTAQPMMPHLPTSSKSNPQYFSVDVEATDVGGNSVSSTDTVMLSEASQSPLFSVALAGKNGKLQTIPLVKGGWTFKLSQLTDHDVYIASAQPGVATFKLADVTNPSVTPAVFNPDFVNSMVTAVKAPAPNAAAIGGGIQTVEADLVDQNGQTVINSADQVALAIKKPRGQVVVTDGDGNPLPVDSNGRYLAQAVSGVAKFSITDTMVEPLVYTFVDMTESKVTGATSIGNFITPAKFVMTPIANGSLGNDQPVNVKLTATDSKGLPLGRATVYLAFVQTAGGGQAVVNGDTPTALTTTAQPFVTDDQGNVMITYTTPHVLPNGGTDSIVVQDNQDPKKARVKTTDSYAFAAAAKYVWSGDGKTIAKTGTLSAGQPTTVTMTAMDAKNHALPNTTVYLSLSATNVGGTATVVEAETGLSSTPTPYITDANGQVTVTYTTPQYLPGNETDAITAQDLNSKTPHVKSADSYTYKAVGKLSFDTTLGKAGSLAAGATVNVKLTVQDATKNAMPNTVVYLSLKSLGGSTAFVDPSNAINGTTDLSGQLLPFVTDANGNILITYTVADLLPNGGTDTLAAQDATVGAKQKVSLSYTYLRQLI